MVSDHDHEKSLTPLATVELAAQGPQMSRIREKSPVVVGPACDISTAMIPASKWFSEYFLAHPLFNTPTHNHKPQLGPQHIITMTKCGKMELICTGFDVEYCISPELSCK